MYFEMHEINIDKTLFLKLREDYKNARGQIKFFNGLDYLESMIKFFGVISLSVIKEIDEDNYKTVFFQNFKVSPSLGDYKSLATQSFNKKNKTQLLGKHILYDRLCTLFTKKDLNLELDMAEDIISDNSERKKRKIKTLWSLFEDYVVNFRNKLKGHSASFSKEDEEFAQIILSNLDLVLETLEKKLEELLEDSKLRFVYKHKIDSNDFHSIREIILIYENNQYNLSPLMVFLTCNKFSCKKDHKTKIFFYNDGKASNLYYLDYGFNHHFYFSENNDIDASLQQITKTKRELNEHYSSDMARNSDLLKVFVGRQKELEISKKHIVKGIAKNNPTCITIQGKPGTGKSAFVSKLQSELVEENKGEIHSYIFYARKGNMGVEENKYFYNKLAGYLSSIDIEINKLENFQEATDTEKLENLFRSLEEKLQKPLLIIIDGLDEFKSIVNFLNSFPLTNIPNRVHLVFSARGYVDILDLLRAKLFATKLDILNKKDYFKNSSSVTLEGLKENETYILIDEVLTKDIRRDTQEYKDIQKEIYIKSEGLPLYIYYTINKLINFDTKNFDIPKAILQFSKELPSGLDEFYFSSFKELDTLSSQILYILYFSAKPISFDSFYYLILQLRSKSELQLDKKEFQNRYFSKVEIFLNQNTKSNYSFYHLSVKEAIRSYFTNQTDNLQHIVEINYDAFSKTLPIADYQVSQYKELFDEFYYLKEDATLFELIDELQKLLVDKQKDKKLGVFFKDNFLSIYHKYIWFKIYQETITYEEAKEKRYESFDDFKLSKQNHKAINIFFNIYEKSDKVDITEIKYAYELALLVEDYDRVLSCADDFQETFTNIFIDICWNLDKKENQRKFKELKPIWQELYSDKFKTMLLTNHRILAFTQNALEITDTIKHDDCKSLALAKIAKKVEDKELFKKALEIANAIEDDLEKWLALEEIELANMIEDDLEKSEALVTIAEKTKEIEQALEIVNEIEDNFYKLEALAKIVKKIEDKELLKKALEIVNKIEKDSYKSKALATIVVRTEDKEQALEIVNEIEDNFYKLEALAIIVERTEDKELLKKALEIIANAIENDFRKSRVLATIAEKTGDKKLFKKALELTNVIEDDFVKSITLATIAEKTGDKKLFKKALEIANAIEDHSYKSKALVSIAIKTEEIEQSLEIANAIEDDSYKSRVLATIAERTEETRQALEIANAIKDNSYKSRVLATIAEKTGDKKLFKKALEITNVIEDDFGKSIALARIAEKTEEVEQVLEIANAIDSNIQRISLNLKLKDKSNNNYFLDNLIFIQNQYQNIEINEALEFVQLKNDSVVLRYYGINTGNEMSQFEKTKITLIKLQVKRQKAEETENESLYEELTCKAEEIKQEILNNENLLEEFLGKYKIKKMKFKSMDILDIEF